jgi:hypothetical protein
MILEFTSIIACTSENGQQPGRSQVKAASQLKGLIKLGSFQHAVGHFSHKHVNISITYKVCNTKSGV